METTSILLPIKKQHRRILSGGASILIYSSAYFQTLAYGEILRYNDVTLAKESDYYMRTAAFIGTGNMGGALAQAACRAISPAEVILANRSHEKADSLARSLGCIAAMSNEAAIRSAKYIFLGVKPQAYSELAKELAPVLQSCHQAGQDKVLISMAAGLTLSTLKSLYSEVGYDIPILRIMPNTCVTIGKGVVALAGEDETHLAAVERILSGAGLVERLPEHLLDAFTSVAGCGPAFVYPYIEALADGGVMAGLPRDRALRYAAQTVLGAAAMVLETGKHPGQLKDEVCSPGGSTIAGITALERCGLRNAAASAVLASWERNKELGKS